MRVALYTIDIDRYSSFSLTSAICNLLIVAIAEHWIYVELTIILHFALRTSDNLLTCRSLHVILLMIEGGFR